MYSVVIQIGSSSGEELFISYGTSEWFTDRGARIVSQPVHQGKRDEGGGGL